MKFCSNCYSPLKDDELFCSNCGARVSGHNETTAQGHDKPEHEHLEPTQSHDNPEHEHLEPNQDPTDYGDNLNRGNRITLQTQTTMPLKTIYTVTVNNPHLRLMLQPLKGLA